MVAGGGTGNTTFTAYSVIAAGTTATGTFQNVSGVGTSGQILTSNGASALPTWQTAPSGTFSPNSVISIFDDFISSASNGVMGVLSWIVNGTVASTAITASNAHPGIIGFGATTASNSSGIALKNQLAASSSTSGTWIVGGGAITMNWVFNIATASNSTNRYILRFGFNDGNPGSGDITNGVYFEYSDNINSGDWNYKTSSASTRTTSTSSVAVTTGWHNAQSSINAAGTSVSFS